MTKDVKQLAQGLAQHGRNGDTMLAHISPLEAEMLRAMGGSGTINPETGLPEYWGWNPFRAIAEVFSPVVDVFSPILDPVSDVIGTGGGDKGLLNVIDENLIQQSSDDLAKFDDVITQPLTAPISAATSALDDAIVQPLTAPISKLGTEIDDTVNEVIPGGWATVAQIVAAVMTGGAGLALTLAQQAAVAAAVGAGADFAKNKDFESAVRKGVTTGATRFAGGSVGDYIKGLELGTDVITADDAYVGQSMRDLAAQNAVNLDADWQVPSTAVTNLVNAEVDPNIDPDINIPTAENDIEKFLESQPDVSTPPDVTPPMTEMGSADLEQPPETPPTNGGALEEIGKKLATSAIKGAIIKELSPTPGALPTTTSGAGSAGSNAAALSSSGLSSSSAGAGQSGTSQSGGIPTPISGQSLAAAPVYGNTQVLQQLKQLDPKLLSMVAPHLAGQANASMASGLSALSPQIPQQATGGNMQQSNPYNTLFQTMLADKGGTNPSYGAPMFSAASNMLGYAAGGSATMDDYLTHIKKLRDKEQTGALMSSGLKLLGAPAYNTMGFKDGGHIPEFKTGTTGHYVKGAGDGQSDDIPAMLADGEYVFDADTVASLGNGSSDAGAQLLDHFREAAREHKRSAPVDKIPPKASPLAYMKEALKRHARG